MFNCLLECTLKESNSTVFSFDNVQSAVDEIKRGLKFPYVDVRHSTLGGKENVSILITVSLEQKEAWPNGILENSNYARFHLDNDGELEHFSGYGIPKIRKSKFNSIEKVIDYVNLKTVKKV